MKYTNVYSVVSILIMSMIILGSWNVKAEDMGVEVNNDYIDTNPVVWGIYIVWTRGSDLSLNGQIEITEPSWIMIYDITSKESWNITPNTGTISAGNYNHARYPDIYGDKVIYQYRISTSGTGYRLGMYNISKRNDGFNEANWKPIQNLLPSASGNYHCIYGDWIYSSESLNSGVFYNYKNEDRFLINMGTDFVTCVAITETYLTYLWTNNAQTSSRVRVINLDDDFEYRMMEINPSSKAGNPVKMNYQDVYYNYLGFGLLENIGGWNLYALDLNCINWSLINGHVTTVPTSIGWTSIDDYIIEVNIESYATTGCKIWLNKVYYGYIDGSSIYNFKVYDMNKNKTSNILSTPVPIGSYDVYYDKVVWNDMRLGTFNIYRLTTTTENFSDILVLALPVIFIGILVALFWKAFKGLGGV